MLDEYVIKIVKGKLNKIKHNRTEQEREEKKIKE